ncbi:MAG: type II toxin-antitoxin system YafQ family toxin [Nitrospirales bacterium]
MRTIERATAFKRDYKRVKATPRYSKDIDGLLSAIVERLATDHTVPLRNRDHELSGHWHGYRECHLKPDLLLIYRKPDAGTLRLARLGSHSELFE